MAFKVATSSCESRWVKSYGCYSMVALGCKAWFRLGDHPYINQTNNPNAWGTDTITALDKDSTVADVSKYYTQSLANPGTALARQSMHLYHMMDDHEWMGEAWDHTITRAETNNPIGVSGTLLEQQNQVNAHHAVCRAAFLAADNDNNNGVVFTTSADIPSGAQENGASPDSANYVANGFRVGYTFNGSIDNDNPDVDFFVLDCINGRDPIADTDGAGKTMLGANQKAAFKAALLASPATYKVIMSTKKFFTNGGGENEDGWCAGGGNQGYETERDEILDYIRDNSITGCFAISGDKHFHTVDRVDTDEGDDWDFVNVTSAVFSNTPNGGDDSADTTVFCRSNTTTPRAEHGYVTIDFNPTRALIEIRYAHRGAAAAPMWAGQIEAGSNKLSYPELQVAV